MSNETPSVFHELGLPDADELVIKSELATAIVERVKARGLNQTAAASALGMPRTEVSHLMHGRISRFTIDRLIRALSSLDRTVRMRLVVESREADNGAAAS